MRFPLLGEELEMGFAIRCHAAAEGADGGGNRAGEERADDGADNEPKQQSGAAPGEKDRQGAGALALDSGAAYLIRLVHVRLIPHPLSGY